MNENRFIDPSTHRKGIASRDDLRILGEVPVFSIVEFNVIAACSRKCSFCPISLEGFYDMIAASGRMELKFYKKILNDLSEIDYEGKLLFSGFCEPLLHTELDKILSLSKEMLPKSGVELNSNGDLLTTERLRNLFGSGLDSIVVSLYDGPHQYEIFKSMQNAAGLNDEQVVVRRRFFQNGNYGMAVSNRGGLIDSNQFRAEKEKKIEELPLKKECYYPFYQIKIDFNGDMLLCSHDWQKRFVVGNLKINTIWELWTGDKLQGLKKRLARADRNMVPCDTCDVHGDLIGIESFLSWKEYFDGQKYDSAKGIH